MIAGNERGLWPGLRVVKEESMQSQEELIDSCRPMVRYFARKLVPKHTAIDYEDIVSEGYVGLVRAARSFDADRGISFSTFAAISIRGAIIDALRKATPVSRRSQKALQRLDRASLDLTHELGREPCDGEVALRMDVAESEVEHLRRLRTLRVVSLDEQHERSDHEIASSDSTEEAALRLVQAVEVRRCINGLLPREQDVIRRHYLKGESQKKIAADLGLSESRICQVHRRALDRLRTLVESSSRATAA